MKKGEEFEKLVAAIEKFLGPQKSVRVEHNVKLRTQKGTDRQIDILIEQDLERFHFRTIIECKDHKAKVNVREVNAFKTLIESVAAHQGIIVAKSGFQKGAINEARNEKILLYELSDIDNAAEYIRTALISQYTTSIECFEVNVRFKCQESINADLNFYTKLKSIQHDGSFSIVEVMEDFIRRNQIDIADKFSKNIIVQNGTIAIVDGTADSSINFNHEVYYESNGIKTIIQGFDSKYKIVFRLTPAIVENVKAYKNIRTNDPSAFVVDLTVAGEKFTIIDKSLDDRFITGEIRTIKT